VCVCVCVDPVRPSSVYHHGYTALPCGLVRPSLVYRHGYTALPCGLVRPTFGVSPSLYTEPVSTQPPATRTHLGYIQLVSFDPHNHMGARAAAIGANSSTNGAHDHGARELDDPGPYGPVGRSPWLDIDWRKHQRWVIVDGTPVNTIELGGEHATSEQPLVFVHGLSGCWANWLEQLPVFAREHRVLTLDLPGFGASPMPSQQHRPATEISISGYARLLDRLMDELGIDAATVIGNSMGGFISAELAIAFPQRVERLVLVSAAGISTTADPRTLRALPIVRRLETVLAAGGAWVASKSDTVARRARLRDALLSVVAAHPSRLPAALTAEQLRGSGKPGFMQALQAILDYDIRERLPEIACPTLIVWGERDRLVNVADADVFAELIPNSRKVIFKDTGHVSMLERPTAFNALLKDFIAE
jgi:pimeloyl-ACP methyl ester carboxylesterase